MEIILSSLLMGIVEGITEWLPISSTGHLILLEQFLPFDVTPEFMEMFRVVIQLGAIMAVVVLYFSRLNPFTSKKTAKQKRNTWGIWAKVAVASIPAAVIGLLFDDYLNAMFYNPLTVALMLIVYGVAFIVVERFNKNKIPRIDTIEEMDYKTVLIIGLFQVLALIPGTSRSGATIVGGLILGASRKVSAEFTFFLAIPVMFGASLLKLIGFGFEYTSDELIILAVGMISAFVVSIFAIKFLVGYIKKHSFSAFGVYRIILGIAVISLMVF